MHTSSRRIKREASDLAAKRLLEFCWVISLQRFVKIADPLNHSHSYSEEQFDEAFAQFAPVIGCAPSSYLRVNNKHHRVVTRIDMLPGEAEKIIPLPDEYPLKALNLSAPPPVPELPEDPFPDVLMNHLTFLFDYDQDKVHHFLFWLGHLVHRPETRMNHGIMISGGQGTGKSFLGEVIKRLIGEQNFLETNVAKLKGRFNDFLSGRRCLLVEEVTDNNGSDFYNSIKAYFTSPTLQVEVKHGPIQTVQNHTHWLLLSNSRRPLAIDKDDRRIFYIHSNAEPKDAAYYDQLWGALDTEVAKLFHFLKRSYLPGLKANFAVTPPPKTEDHKQLAMVAEDDLSVMLHDALEVGEGFFQAGVFFRWIVFKSHVDLLCKQNGVKPRDLKMLFLELGGKQKRVTIEGEKISVAWLKAGNDDLPTLFKDNSKAGRDAVKQRYHLPSYSSPSHDIFSDSGSVL